MGRCMVVRTTYYSPARAAGIVRHRNPSISRRHRTGRHDKVYVVWHQLIDHPESYQESSSTAMFAYTMITGVKSLGFYLKRPTQKGNPHGQAPVLWRVNALLRM